jgi:hypothetical protein
MPQCTPIPAKQFKKTKKKERNENKQKTGVCLNIRTFKEQQK